MTPARNASDVLDWLRRHASAGAHLRLDSRAVQLGDIFLAYAGARNDGRDFIEQALVRGAAVVVYDDCGGERAAGIERTLAGRQAPGLAVAGLKSLLGALASSWYGEPSRDMTVIAVTGTNGKTSCTQWISQVLTAHGSPCGVIGTLGIQMPSSIGAGQSIDTGLTTPDAVALHRALADMRRAGVDAVAIEASSIGIAEGRMDGLHVDVAVFTNLTRDHLDYHGSMAAYEAEKARLFAWPGVKAAIVNLDDEAGRRLVQRVGAGVELTGYTLAADPQGGVAAERTLRASDLHATSQGMVFTLGWHGNAVQISTPLLGAHNVANLLALAGVLFALGWDAQPVAAAVASAQPAPGRLQAVGRTGGRPGDDVPLVVVDYAHTPDALARALDALAPVAAARGGRRLCLFGCGGDRDAGKRPHMAQVACANADLVMVTSDNPRSEDPQGIIDQILAGVPAGLRVQVEPDRGRAIRRAVREAGPADVLLVAGKGHEAYQEISGVRHPFSDADHAARALDDYALPAAGKPGLWSLLDAADAMHGIFHGDTAAGRAMFTGVSTDSRSVTAGDLFFALTGERFDGHAYVRAVAESGALAAVVQRPVDDAALPQIVVGDTRRALGDLAAAWRGRFAIPVVGVTGSNGKTTTKEMVAAIFAARHGQQARLATEGNLNNEIGVPLTLLRLREQHRCAVIELGMNHPGEIALLAGMAAPTVGLVNNAQREHQEFMHTVEAVARENGAVIAGLPADGVAVFPGDDAYTPIWTAMAGGRPCLRFGLGGEADVTASDIRPEAFETRFRLHSPRGDADIALAAAGMHNVRNALAAAACALAAGLEVDDVARGLAEFAPVKGRMQRHRLAAGALLIDDTYNANPDSVRAAIDVLAALPAPRVLVLGDMGEVGNEGPAMHAEVGAYARERGIDALFTLGDATQATTDAFAGAGLHAVEAGQLAPAVLALQPGSVLVKGSRFMRMERVVQALLAGSPSDHSSIGNTKHAA